MKANIITNQLKLTAIQLTTFAMFAWSALAHPSSPLLIGIHGEGQHHVKEFIRGRDPLTIEDFSGKFAYRDIVEQILLLQALNKGGYQGEIKLVPVDYYGRRIKLIEKGIVHLSATPFWLNDLKNSTSNLLISSPMVREGEFTAGIYVYHENQHLLKYQSIDQVRQLTAVSNKNWTIDWQALTSMNLSGLVHSGQFPAMTKMLVKGRVDFMLAPFYNSADLSFVEQDQKFIPIPNIKVGLPGERVYALSKKMKNSDKIYEALNQGIKLLRAEGIITKAYEQSGFFNKKTKDWAIINSNNENKNR